MVATKFEILENTEAALTTSWLIADPKGRKPYEILILPSDFISVCLNQFSYIMEDIMPMCSKYFPINTK